LRLALLLLLLRVQTSACIVRPDRVLSRAMRTRLK
jgi:hypothetical protein